MNTEEVVNCVKYTCSSQERERSLNGSCAAIAAGLSSIVQSASFVEVMAAKCLGTGSLSLGLYAFAKSGERDEPRQLFTLFGPTAKKPNTERSPISSLQQRSGAVVPNGRDVEDANAPEEVEDNAHIGDDACAPEGGGGGGGGSGTGRRSSILPNMGIRNQDENYSIPEDIAAKTLSFSLDISGATYHSSNYKSKDTESVNAKKFAKAVKSIFKKHKESISSRGIKAHGLQYLSMIPMQLRKKHVTFPLLRLCRHRSGAPYIRTGSMKVELDISKADNNTKEQNMALVSIMMHYRSHGIEVEEVLLEHAVLGLGEQSCDRFGSCRAKLPDHPCKDAVREICCFFGEVNGERKLVGKGVVDPYTTFLLGKEVPESSMVVRVKRRICMEGFNQREREGSNNVDVPAYIWPKNDIGRVDLLGELGDVIGTGITVREKILSARTRQSRNAMDIGFAVIVCDVEIQERSKDEKYPFSEWYKCASVRRIELPFAEGNDAIPTKMRDISMNRRRCMLWHRKFLRTTETR